MTIFIDLDGTLCTSPNTFDYRESSPILVNIAKCNRLYEAGNRIIIWTARGTKTGLSWFHVTIAQLNAWGVRYHELRMGKPDYDLFIDDKAIHASAWTHQTGHDERLQWRDGPEILSES